MQQGITEKHRVTDSKRVGVNNPEIQGLYPVKNAHQSFWSLLSKVELAVVRDIKKELKHINE